MITAPLLWKAGCKADAINAGINASNYPYFLNTDVDCILDKDTLIQLIQPFVDDEKRVIATGATLRMVNDCVVESGVLAEACIPKGFLPRFQEIEYIRSFVLGKMGGFKTKSGGIGFQKTFRYRTTLQTFFNYSNLQINPTRSIHQYDVYLTLFRNF